MTLSDFLAQTVFVWVLTITGIVISACCYRTPQAVSVVDVPGSRARASVLAVSNVSAAFEAQRTMRDMSAALASAGLAREQSSKFPGASKLSPSVTSSRSAPAQTSASHVRFGSAAQLHVPMHLVTNSNASAPPPPPAAAACDGGSRYSAGEEDSESPSTARRSHRARVRIRKVPRPSRAPETVPEEAGNLRWSSDTSMQ